MKNRLMKKEDCIIRILEEREDKVFVIDCIKKTMPYWCDAIEFSDFEICYEEFETITEELLSAAEKRIMHERYTLIAGILPFVSDEKMRSLMISKVSEQKQVSKQTIRKYLCQYLVYQDMSVLAPNIESVTKFAEEYLKDNALELYARLKRKLQAEKPSVSFSYCHEYADIEDDYGRSIADYTYDSDTMCISLPCSILGEEVCDIIKTFDGDCEIAFDGEEKAVKIYHSLIDSNNRIKQRILTRGIKIGETSVRSFLNSDVPNENSNDDSYEEQEQQDENFEENANQILAMFKTVEDKNEETAAASEEDTVLV